MTSIVTKADDAIPLDRAERLDHTNIAPKDKIEELRGTRVTELSDDENSIPPSLKKSSSGFPVVFVGFGTGAHSLVSLGERALLSALGGDCNHSGSRGLGCRKLSGDNQPNSSDKSSSLASALVRRGLHVGGLILVNGFVSLEDRSCQARTIHDLSVSWNG